MIPDFFKGRLLYCRALLQPNTPHTAPPIAIPSDILMGGSSCSSAT
eukprot:gene7327-2957_t